MEPTSIGQGGGERGVLQVSITGIDDRIDYAVPCYHIATVSRKILAVEPGVDQQTGASMRVAGLLSRLQGPFEVERLALPDLCAGFSLRPPAPERWRFLTRRPAWALSFSHQDLQQIRERLDRHLDGKDLLWLAHGSTAAKLGLDQAPLANVPVIVDAYDLLWTALERRLKSAARAATGWRGRRIDMEIARARRFERRLYAAADQVWVCSELDRQRLDPGRAVDRPAAERVRVVPNFFEAPALVPDSTAEEAAPEAAPEASEESAERPIVFVGTMGYYPNRQGMEWFLERVWPRVIAQRPASRLWVVGGWPTWVEPGSVYRQPGVAIRGFVDDLASVWRRAAALVCPLQIGSGTRIKILEAWSHRVPVVSTSVGIEGLDAQSGSHALVADDPGSQAIGLIELLDDADQRQRLAEGGYRLWQERYTLDRVAAVAIEGCEALETEHQKRTTGSSF